MRNYIRNFITDVVDCFLQIGYNANEEGFDHVETI